MCLPVCKQLLFRSSDTEKNAGTCNTDVRTASAWLSLYSYTSSPWLGQVTHRNRQFVWRKNILCVILLQMGSVAAISALTTYREERLPEVLTCELGKTNRTGPEFYAELRGTSIEGEEPKDCLLCRNLHIFYILFFSFCMWK